VTVEPVSTVLWFLLALGVLITVHEAGHFLVAKRLGVKVLRFSVGFGRPLWARRYGADRTEYVVAALPLGGYVKMLDEREGPVPPAERPRAFNRQRLGVRTAVVAAGPIANLLFAAIAYWLMFLVGVTGLRPLVGEVSPGSAAERAGLSAGDEVVSVGERPTPTWEAVIREVIGTALERDAVDLEVESPGGYRHRVSLDLSSLPVEELARGGLFDRLGAQPARPQLPPVVGQVEAGGAAARGGLQAGDRILLADGKPMPDWRTWVELVRESGGREITLEVERGGARELLRLRPDRVSGDAGEKIGRIGAAVAMSEETVADFYATERYGPATALQRGVLRTWEVSGLTVRMLWKMLTLEVSLENLSGPISIAQYAGHSARGGLSRFLEFLGVVSVSLAVLNLLPVPLLDGGHLMYYLIELIKGRPLSEEAQLAGQRLGLAILIGLMGLAFVNDLARLLG
jgi:regulator of sigma E protease